MHSLLMARINGSPLRVDVESLSPSQCERLQFQKRDVSWVSEGDQQFSPAGFFCNSA